MYSITLDSNTPMFDDSLILMSENRINLLYWCKFYYHNYYTQSEDERPDEFTLEHDILFDDWLERKAFSERTHTGTRARSSANDMSEVVSFGG